MFTIFCTAKPFRDHNRIIQVNAIRSWTLLRPKPEILLFGDEEGYDGIAQELGLRHISDVERNEYGTPLLSSMFPKAQELASNPLLCYLDADIILMEDFIQAVEQVTNRKGSFLMTGQTNSLDIDSSVAFEDPTWEQGMRERTASSGKTHGSWWGMDYFLFPRGTFPDFPAFAVGRPGWDNWLIYHILYRRIPVIDATQVVTSIHQTHDYSHLQGGFSWYKQGRETAANLKLADGPEYLFCVADATHLLTQRGVRAALTVPHLWRRIYTLPVLRPRFRFLRPILTAILGTTRAIRAKVGLNLDRL